MKKIVLLQIDWKMTFLYFFLHVVSPAILEPRAIEDILTHLRLPDKPPGLAPPRIPEQFQFS